MIHVTGIGTGMTADRDLRRRNTRLAFMLGLVALGVFVAFFLVNAS